MRSIIKICDMVTAKDVAKIKEAIATNEGVIACGIHKQKKEAEIVYNDNYISLDDIIDAIEEHGYTVV